MKSVKMKYGFLGLIVFLCGCLPSLQPLYTDDTIVFDEALLGKWYGEDGGSIWSFTQDGENKYKLRVLEADAKEAKFEVHLVQVGDHRFIDLYPGDDFELKDTPAMFNCNLVAAHTFMKLDLSEPNLSLQWINFGDLLSKEPEILKHEKHGDEVILITAEPEDIQKALIENLDEVLEGDACVFQKCPVDFSEVDIIFDQEILGQWESDDDDYLDIIALDNEYDILFSDSENQQTFNGVLYNLSDHPVLGLYYISDGSNESGPDMDLPPDILVMIECSNNQLKIQAIEWDEVDKFMNDSSKYCFENSEPDDVFFRVSD